jgi:two-component system alkaline phosphatase synthesis response regulator PhoP
MDPKVLIVDDEAYNRLLIGQALEELEDHGVKILTAANGTEGLDIILSEKPRLVFLDVMMHQMNGFDVCQNVKRELGKDQVYIVMLTAKGQEYDRQKGLEVGADMFMTKPFDPDTLLELTRTVLGEEPGLLSSASR